MNRRGFGLVLTLALAAAAPALAGDGGGVDTRIVDGSLARDGDWPWQTVLFWHVKVVKTIYHAACNETSNDNDITSEVDGYLLVFDINPTGKLTQLFPNRFANGATPAKIVKGEHLHFPSAHDRVHLPVGEPLGKGMVVALAAGNPAALADLARRNGELTPVSDVEEFVGRSAPVLKDAQSVNPLNGAVDWSLGETRYEVVK